MLLILTNQRSFNLTNINPSLCPEHLPFKTDAFALDSVVVPHNENRVKAKVERFVLELKKIKAKFKGDLEFVELDELLSLLIYEF